MSPPPTIERAPARMVYPRLMQTKTYTNIDRSTWPSGPWDNEPDKKQWQDEATGMPCLAVRVPHSGHWCGYVGVTPGHIYHGKDYNDVEELVHVHGGLTFASACANTADESRHVCHTPDEGEEHNVWWFGFDCAHCDDVSPARKGCGFPGEAYRTLRYVEQECGNLARQLQALGNDPVI